MKRRRRASTRHQLFITDFHIKEKINSFFISIHHPSKNEDILGNNDAENVQAEAIELYHVKSYNIFIFESDAFLLQNLKVKSLRT